MFSLFNKKGRHRLARISLIILLSLGILAPKVTLATAAAFGIGFDSITLCTGSGLQRVTVAPNGDIVSPDVAADSFLPKLSGEQCAPASQQPLNNGAFETELQFRPLSLLTLYRSNTRLTSPGYLVKSSPPRAPPVF